MNAQRGRQSGSTVSGHPLDDWTSDVEDQVDTFGAGAMAANDTDYRGNVGYLRFTYRW